MKVIKKRARRANVPITEILKDCACMYRNWNLSRSFNNTIIVADQIEK